MFYVIVKRVLTFIVVFDATLTLALPKLSTNARQGMLVDISDQGQTELGSQHVVLLKFHQSSKAFPQALRASKDLSSYVQVTESHAKVVLYPQHSKEVLRSLDDQGRVLYAEDVLVEPELEPQVISALSNIGKLKSRRIVNVDFGTAEEVGYLSAGGEKMMRRNTGSQKHIALWPSGIGSSLLQTSSIAASDEITFATDEELRAAERVDRPPPPAQRPPGVVLYLLLTVGVGALAGCFCLGAWYVLSSLSTSGTKYEYSGPAYLHATPIQANTGFTTSGERSEPAAAEGAARSTIATANAKDEDSDSADDVPLKAAAAKASPQAKAQDSDEDHEF